MNDLSKPLFSLTIGEYKKLQQEIVEEQFSQPSYDRWSNHLSYEQDIIYANDVCRLTGYEKATLYSKVSKYEISVLSRGKPLTFSKKAILKWIKNGKPSVNMNSSNNSNAE